MQIAVIKKVNYEVNDTKTKISTLPLNQKDIIVETYGEKEELIKLSTLPSNDELFNVGELVEIVNDNQRHYKIKKIAIPDILSSSFLEGLHNLIKAEEVKLNNELSLILPEQLEYHVNQNINYRRALITKLLEIFNKINSIITSEIKDEEIKNILESIIQSFLESSYIQEIDYTYWMMLAKIYKLGQHNDVSKEKLNMLKEILLNVKVLDIYSSLREHKLILQREELNK